MRNTQTLCKENYKDLLNVLENNQNKWEKIYYVPEWKDLVLYG